MQSDLSGIKPVVWKVEPVRPEEEIIHAAADLVRAGGIVIYPTETFYAVGGLPDRVETIQHIAEIKGRSPDKPFPLIAASQADVSKAVAFWPTVAEKLAHLFWPGPLTLILPVSPMLPKELHLDTGRIAVRISSHPVATSLARSSGGLLISTSANISGQPAISDPEQIDPGMIKAIDGMIHGGRTAGKTPSTIVDVTEDKVRLIRAGSLPWSEIEGRLHACA